MTAPASFKFGFQLHKDSLPFMLYINTVSINAAYIPVTSPPFSC